MRQCPKCEYELTMAEQVSSPEQCPSCDIYFAKYQVRMEQEKARREEAEKKALREKALREKAAEKAKASSAQKVSAPIRATREPSFRLAADPVKVATRGLSGVQPVVVVDVHVRFWSMVTFMVKAAFAAIPAMIILLVAFTGVVSFFGALAIADDKGACVSFTSSEIRAHQIRDTIKIGMTAAHVERIWGKPTKVRRDSTGNAWEYWSPAGDEIVTFGSHDCVTNWYMARG